MKLFVILFLIGLGAAGYFLYTAPPSISEQIIPQSKPRMILFGIKDSMSTQQMQRNLDAVNRKFHGNIITEFCDVKENSEKKIDYRISVIPSVILLASDKKEVFRQEGFITEETLCEKTAEFVHANSGEISATPK